MRNVSILGLVTACSGSPAVVVELPVTTSAEPMPVAMTDLGYAVTIADLRVAVSTVEFTIEGETHAGEAAVARYAIPPPPHPGHSAGGEVTGELAGDHVLHWNGQAQAMLGLGALIVGDYHGANFVFRAAGAGDQLASDDRLLGHTFHLTGSVMKDGTTKPFSAVLDVEPDTAVVGAVFEADITETSTATLAMQFFPIDPFELDTPFDGVDFFSLPETSGSLEVVPGSAAHNIMRRAIQTHDHYAIVAQ